MNLHVSDNMTCRIQTLNTEKVYHRQQHTEIGQKGGYHVAHGGQDLIRFYCFTHFLFRGLFCFGGKSIHKPNQNPDRVVEYFNQNQICLEPEKNE